MSTQRARTPIWQRTVTWGESLKLRISKDHGSLARYIAPSQQLLGDIIGSSHNTWRRLFTIDDPRQLDGADLTRAWLLLVTMREDPADWGINEEEAVPAGFDRDRLVRELPRLVAGAGFEPATSGLRARHLHAIPGGRHDWQPRTPGRRPELTVIVPTDEAIETGAAA